MKKGFTMIELIFVIVILGILAAVAIPKLAATRDDAKAASIKTDIGTAMQAIPAWFQGQKEVAFQNAMSLDTNVWKQRNAADSAAGADCIYKYTDPDGSTITMKVVQSEDNSTVVSNCPNSTSAVSGGFGKSPFLEIDLTPASGVTTGIVYTLKNDMGVNDSNTTLGGKKVKW